MPRGGAREGSGRPKLWKLEGESIAVTRTVRIPERFADELMMIAFAIDQGDIDVDEIKRRFDCLKKQTGVVV